MWFLIGKLNYNEEELNYNCDTIFITKKLQ